MMIMVMMMMTVFICISEVKPFLKMISLKFSLLRFFSFHTVDIWGQIRWVGGLSYAL